MVRGLFTAYTGMSNEQKRLDIVANNLANSATVGYKKDSVTNQAFDDVLTIKIKDNSEAYNDRPIGYMSPGVKIGEVYTSFEQGSLRQTENPYHLALQGEGFFQLAVTDSEGNTNTRYTRNGTFVLASDGHIVDNDGNRLMGENGEIVVPQNTVDIVVDEAGNIYSDGILVDTLAIANFEDYNFLIKHADTMFEAVEGAIEVDSTAAVVQGYMEQSNVNVVSEMVDMIAITRAYEANQKVIQSIDRTLDLASNSVGKV